MDKKKKKKRKQMLEIEADGKQELVEGIEPLKKDPLQERWLKLKKAIAHKKAFMSIEDEFALDEEDEEEDPSGQNPEEMPDESMVQDDPGSEEMDGPMPEDAPEMDDSGDRNPLEAMAGLEGDEGEAVSAPTDFPGGEDDSLPPMDGGEGDMLMEGDLPEGDLPPEELEEIQDLEEHLDEAAGEDPDIQELVDALREEGYSDHEIAYIIHGHHAPEVDPIKHVKAQSAAAMSDLEVQNAAHMAELEREHARRRMDHEHEHKMRMAELDYEGIKKKHNLAEIDERHRQRMLDLEYEHAQKQKELELIQAAQLHQSKVPNNDPDIQNDIKRVEVEKKRLELKMREEEMKMELEFKRREKELKLKLMERQLENPPQVESPKEPEEKDEQD